MWFSPAAPRSIAPSNERPELLLLWLPESIVIISQKHYRPETPVPRDFENMAGPILGYFGVVDERLDYELIRRIAFCHPEWSVVLVGPHVKVNPNEFPSSGNLFWLGGRSYQELPLCQVFRRLSHAFRP